MVHVVVQHVVDEVAGEEAGRERGTPAAAEHQRRRAGQNSAASGIDTDGGITSRIGSFGWSWWTPWMIQCSRAPMPVLGLEVEDDAVQPVLGQRPEQVAADRPEDPAVRPEIAVVHREEPEDQRAEEQHGHARVHPGQLVERRRLEDPRRCTEHLRTSDLGRSGVGVRRPCLATLARCGDRA